MFVCALVLYTATLTPSVSAGDNGELTTAMFFLGIAHAPGYPLHSFIGKLATFLPIHNVGWRSNFFSAICGALTIYFSVLVFIKLLLSFSASKTAARLSAFFGGAVFMLNNTLWSQAVFCEVYTLSAVFFPVHMLILLSWFDAVLAHKNDEIPYFGERYLAAFSFLFGVALTGHQTALVTGAYAAVFILFVLVTVVIVPRKLTRPQMFHGIVLLIWGVISLAIAARFYQYYIVRLHSNLYVKDNVMLGMGGFITGNIMFLLPWLYYRFIAPDSADPVNYFQRGYFVIAKMILAAYLGWIILFYMFIRSHGSPPINWMGINEAKEYWLKIGKLWNAVYRKQYGDMGKLPPVLFNRVTQFRLLFTGIHADQYTLPIYCIAVLGFVQLFRRYRLMFFTLLFMLVSYNGLLTLNLRYNFERRDMFFVSVFFIFSYFSIAIAVTSGIHFLFEMSGKITARVFVNAGRAASAAAIAIPSVIILTLLCDPFFILKPIREQSVMFHRYFLPNQNAENYACHNYAYNMMMSTEPNAIFMTEGGDNQVFSLVYFSYCEQKRPDVDFFDQKGNVFPRLYGDLMNMWPDDLDIIRELRDFQLYSTGRPVYLTWRRGGLENLRAEYFPELLKRKQFEAAQHRRPMRAWKLDTISDLAHACNTMVPKETFDCYMKNGEHLSKQHFKYLGPWYFQTYGLLYRVTPIRYAIVDALEIYSRAGRAQILDYVKKVSSIDLTDKEFDSYIKELGGEKYIIQEGQQYVLVRPLDRPFRSIGHDDYWKNYYLTYTNAAHAVHWDYLTREIFVNYGTLMASFSEEQKWKLSEQERVTGNPQVKMKLLESIQQYHNSILDGYRHGAHYGHENPAIQFHYANALLQSGNTDEAIKYYERAGQFQGDMHIGFLQIAQVYLNKAHQVPYEEEVTNLQTAAKYAAFARERIELAHRKSGSIDAIQQSQDYNRVSGLAQKITGEIACPRSVLDAQISAAEKSRSYEDYRSLVKMYEQRIDYPQAINIHNQLSGMAPGSIAPRLEKFNFIKNFNQIEAVGVLEDILNNFHNFTDANVQQKLGIIDACAQFYFSMGRNAANQNAAAQAIEPLQKSRGFFQQFIETLRSLNDPQSIQHISSAEKNLIQINRLLNRFQPQPDKNH